MIGDGRGRTWYDLMQVCENGHKITGMGKSYPEDLMDRCSKCGGITFIKCPNCGTDIPGYKHYPNVASPDDSQPPDFCNKCGEPFPWITKNKKLERNGDTTLTKSSNKVFIVHGHDDELKSQLEQFLYENNLVPVILHKKPNEGMTIIEKFEKHSNVGYAFIILTPDDFSIPAYERNKLLTDLRQGEYRARQNVIFEWGYFIGKLGRKNVCCLIKPDVKLPTDLSGIVYKEINNSIREEAHSIIKELNSAGFKNILNE